MKIWGFSCEGFVLGHWGENSGTRMENPMKMRQQVCWEEMVPDVTERWAHAWESSQWPKWRTAVEESRRATAPPSPSACWHKRAQRRLHSHLFWLICLESELTFQSPGTLLHPCSGLPTQGRATVSLLTTSLAFKVVLQRPVMWGVERKGRHGREHFS